MGRDIAIDTPHGLVDGWLAEPQGAPRGALVVLQEIFGVNEHIRSVTERFAAHGYRALAPALFDPVQQDVELDYDDAGFAEGRRLVGELGFDRAVAVLAAAAKRLQSDGVRVGVVGYCWGGSVAFLANTRLSLPAVSYYGARTMPVLDEPLRAPMLFHFGALDDSTPPRDIDAHRAAHPEAEVHVYPAAGHAFNRDVDPRHFHAESAQQALRRTLAFFEAHLS